MTEQYALVIGEALIDIVERPTTPVTEIPGGSPANVALTMARLGRDSILHTWIGADAHGEAIKRHLGASGVRLTAASQGAARTSTARARIGADNAATYAFAVDWNPAPVPPLTPPPLLVHVGSFSAVAAPGGQVVADAVRQGRQDSTITYDPNIRPQLLGEAAVARRGIADLVALADVVKVSDEDLAWVADDPTVDVEAAARAWLELGPAIVVVTRGKAGALALSASGARVEVAADPTVQVVDTVGAGDSFMGGLNDALWRAGLLGAARRQALRAVDADVLQALIQRAAAVADITVARAGANPPTAAELDAALAPDD